MGKNFDQVSFSYFFPSWLSNLRFFDLGFGFLVQNCIFSQLKPKIWSTNNENPIKLIKNRVNKGVTRRIVTKINPRFKLIKIFCFFLLICLDFRHVLFKFGVPAGKLYSLGRGIRIRGRKIANSTARREKLGKTNLKPLKFDFFIFIFNCFLFEARVNNIKR